MKNQFTSHNNPPKPKFPADDYFEVFRNLESVSRKNLDSFCELLEYTYENNRDAEKKDGPQ